VSTAELEAVAGELATLSPPAAPGSWRAALYRPDAPGAELDSQPWARSWGAFLRAVTSRDDASARTYIKRLMDRRAVLRNAFDERIPAEGGFLVPEFLRSQVLAYMTRAIVRPQAMVLPMTSLRMPVPLLDNPSQASGGQALGGLTFAATEEGAAIAGSTSGFGQVVLEARKLAALLAGVPNELVSDASGAFGDFLARVIAMGYAWYEDDLFIGTSGTGVGTPQGLVNAPCAVSITRNTENLVLFADIVAMFKALHPASKQAATMPGVQAATWLVSSSAFDQLLELYYNPSGAEVVPPSGWFSAGDGDKVGASIVGVPAMVTDHQPAVGSTGDVILADLAHYLIGDRMEMTVEQSELGPGFISDTSDFRIKARVDGRYWIQSASTTEAGQQVSPVVVLSSNYTQA
jgi:HK97 family phage major capsid protein